MRSVLCAGLVAAIACSAAAAPDSDYSAKETRKIIYDYAKCVVGHRAGQASVALLSNVDNNMFVRRYSGLIDGDCLHMNAKASFPGDLYRYALADALVEREYANAPVPDLSNVPPIDWGPVPQEPAPLPPNASKHQKSEYEKAHQAFDAVASKRALDVYGECVVRGNPAAAKALLLTQPETAAEDNGFDALRPTLGECLPEGRTLTFGKFVLRGVIAVSYFRLAHAAEPTLSIK
jgi:hypothetical protein